MKDFSKALKLRRIEKRLSQKELAERVGISPVALSYLETGKRLNPRKETVEALARELDCMPEDLTGIAEQSITNEELARAAQSLMQLLQAKGSPMDIVIVTSECADLYFAACGIKRGPLV